MTTLKIEILGTGCKKCHQLEDNARQAATALQIPFEITHITDPVEIATRGIMSTPSLAVNGQVVIKGKVASPEQIQKVLTV